MTSRPKRFIVSIRPSIETRLDDAPYSVRRTFHDLMARLIEGPYPDQQPNFVSEAKGSDIKHLYVAWSENVEVIYRVMQDQPVIAVVGVHWLMDPGDGDGEDWDWTLAA